MKNNKDLINTHIDEEITKGGGPAFPFTEQHANGTTFTAFGMTLRQWYTGMALQGILATGTAKDIASDPEIQKHVGGIGKAADLAISAICGMAVEYADTVIEKENNAK